MFRRFILTCALTLLAAITACGGESGTSHSEDPSMKTESDFTDDERRLLRELGVAVFRNKIILEARPAITADELAKLQEQVDGKPSPELLALWKTSFGGALDYDYEVAFGDHLYSASLRELFYPDSGHYNDLYGWIDHEMDLLQGAAEEYGKPVPEKLPLIPFAGFEYLERFYVSLEPDDYGKIVIYAQGIPWKGRLNEDSVAVVADSVADLFDQLSLNEDPFDANASEYASGKDMAEKILEIEKDHPQLAAKLKAIVRSNLFDWRAVIAATDFSRPRSPKESRALRLALGFAVTRRDLKLIDQLHQKGAPFDVNVAGTTGVLDRAMTHQAYNIVSRLLDLNVNLGPGKILFAANCPDDLLQRLIDRGFPFDDEAVLTAAETGSITGALALVRSGQLASAPTPEEIAKAAAERANNHEEYALKMESGKAGSYLTPAQYREQARLLRVFAGRLRSK